MQHQPVTDQQKQQIQQEWTAIVRAQGYGRSWINWILSFEAIPFVPCQIPTKGWLEDAFQITRCDADAHVRQEYNLRRYHRRHSLDFAKSHTNNANAYRIIRGKEQRFLHDIPTEIETQVTLCRSQKGQTVLRLADPHPIPIGAQITLNNIPATVKYNHHNIMHVADIQAPIPVQAKLQWQTHGYSIGQMSRAFHTYWSQFWRRDTEAEQMSDAPWREFFQEIDLLIPQQPMIDIGYNDPQRLYQSIQKMKSHRAIGADGWHAEELQALTPTMIADLSNLFDATWSKGLTKQLMQARTLLFAKCDKPKAISDGRPITILSYIARTTSKLIADQILQEWTNRWPPEISGGLPRRSARDLSILQLSRIEQSKLARTAWGGWTMDLVKAFNLIPRRVIRYLFVRLGVAADVCDFWFLSLQRMTRALQSGNSLGDACGATTGLPEGDSMSVVGMLALSYLYYRKIQTPNLHPYTYADNWSFMSNYGRKR